MSELSEIEKDLIKAMYNRSCEIKNKQTESYKMNDKDWLVIDFIFNGRQIRQSIYVPDFTMRNISVLIGRILQEIGVERITK